MALQCVPAAVITVLKVQSMLCDHVANLGYVERLMKETSLTTLHGKKAMLKYMHLLSQSLIACDKFARGRGVKVVRELMDEAELRKDTMDVARKMLEGAKSSTRTEMVMQFEEAGKCTKNLSARCVHATEAVAHVEATCCTYSQVSFLLSSRI
jgi:hypothetical protein